MLQICFRFGIAWLMIVCSSVVVRAGELPRTRAKLAAHQPVKIVCLGDSVTGIYYHTGSLRAYPEMIAVGLRLLDPESRATVVNAGISGHSTVNALARLDKDVLDYQPDLVTIMFGLNDMARVSQADFQANLTTLIARCRGAGAEVLLCTPNGIIDTAGRPRTRLEEYNQAMRDVGQETKTPVSDVYAAYEALRGKDEPSFRLLCSDAIHPNMDGHKLNAEVICRTITGKEISLKEVGPPVPVLPRVRQRIAAGETVRVRAMSPADQWIGPALKSGFPDARIEVTAWPTRDQTLVQFHEAARSIRQLSPRPDLVVLAIPPDVTPLLSKPTEADVANYTWILNYSLSFGVQEWDVLGIAPSVLAPTFSPDMQDREAFARRLTRAQDLHLIVRPAKSTDDAVKILADWIAK